MLGGRTKGADQSTRGRGSDVFSGERTSGGDFDGSGSFDGDGWRRSTGGLDLGFDDASLKFDVRRWGKRLFVPAVIFARSGIADAVDAAGRWVDLGISVVLASHVSRTTQDHLLQAQRV